MSRSNPSDNIANPSTRWYEFNGEKGVLKYYSKAEEKNIEVAPKGFTFLVLDILSTIKGWHDASDSGIFSNEVRDLTAQPLTVKAFKGGIIAEGFYSSIKDRIAAAGGVFTTNIYIAYKDGNELKLGSLQFKGASLNAWIEFSKANRGELDKGAVRIEGTQEGKKGRITYQMPVFKLIETSPETNEKAIELDIVLQEFLTKYFNKRSNDQAHAKTEESNFVFDKEDREKKALVNGKIQPNADENYTGKRETPSHGDDSFMNQEYLEPANNEPTDDLSF